jgi:hypothetical protein
MTCTDAANCWAVGSDEHGSLAEHWNGIRWAEVPSHGGSRASLNGVACTSAANCWAVGASNADNAGTVTLHWDGSTWTKLATLTSKVRLANLSGVSCTSAINCVAVGSTLQGVLAEQWNGASWEVPFDGGPSAHSKLAGVACVHGPACMAVGETDRSLNSSTTLAADWNGTAWSLVGTPDPANWPGNGLQAVACVTAANCWAVGRSESKLIAGRERGLIEHWDGAAWTLVP